MEGSRLCVHNCFNWDYLCLYRGKIISKLAKGLMFIVFIAVAIPLSYGVYLVSERCYAC